MENTEGKVEEAKVNTDAIGRDEYYEMLMDAEGDLPFDDDEADLIEIWVDGHCLVSEDGECWYEADI